MLSVIIKIIVPMIRFAEGFFSGKGMGKEKKQLVIDGIKSILSVVSEVSTGGQRDTWKLLGPVLDPVINFLAGLLFPKQEDDE